MVTKQLIAGACRMLCEEHCPYEIRGLVSHPWVMAGRRLAVGFRQLVPGVFPTGVVTDRLRSIVVGPWCSIQHMGVDFRCCRNTLFVFMA
ncbi:hypothetical protein [Oligosphaera ethanolica]|uniref:Uncharacterized protein n=1 Tax=Oligosphaera ethanolica TaxID=760260 RepID=A0AAE4AM77_9BACT|nr:hypothetical protein [Oligosphaera ethanolica]MDQ0289044.1 hypothetical protein [Oligosphaera ethanolica]